MKAKNVMLLGFVNKALDYLEENADDEKTAEELSELKDIDLQSLKEELTENIGSSLDEAQTAVEKLINAGKDAFDSFIDTKKHDSIISELDRLFDTDFDNEDHPVEEEIPAEETSEPAKEDRNEDIESLIAFYGLKTAPIPDDSFEEEEPEEQSEETEEEEVIQEDEAEQTEEVTTDDLSEIGKAIQDMDTQSPAEETEEQENQENAVETSDEDLLSDDDIKDEPKEEETIFEMSEEDDLLYQTIAQNVNLNEEKLLNSNDILGANTSESELDDIFSAVVENREIPQHAADENSVPDREAERLAEEKMLEEVNRSAHSDMVSDIRESVDARYKSLDQLEAERDARDTRIAKELNYIFEKEEEHAEGDDGSYVSSLISELRDRMQIEDEKKKAENEKFAKIYERIHQLYPYLSGGFIRAVYEMKEEIAREYPVDENIILLHRIDFNDIENLRQFVEIGLSHGFSINADENKMIVDIFKNYVNKDGKIISTIFQVANQAALLSGDYEGYNVLYAKEM